jgi:hypothetical protein
MYILNYEVYQTEEISLKWIEDIVDSLKKNNNKIWFIASKLI